MRRKVHKSEVAVVGSTWFEVNLENTYRNINKMDKTSGRHIFSYSDTYFRFLPQAVCVC